MKKLRKPPLMSDKEPVEQELPMDAPMHSELLPGAIEAILESGEDYPIDFDDAWKWIGFTRKDSTVSLLCSNFSSGGIDYIFRSEPKKGEKGRSSHKYALTLDAFKAFCMMAGTEKGKEVRRYFIEIEKEYRTLKANPAPLTKLELARKLHETSGYWLETLEKLEAAEKQIEEDRPHVEFSLAVDACTNGLDMRQMAQSLTNSGHKIGRQLLIDFLRYESVYLPDTNLVYQKYIDSGHFFTRLKTVNDKQRTVCLATPKGEKLIAELVERDYDEWYASGKPKIK